jgi:hypothetical protein
MARDRRGRFTAERITKTTHTHEVTERITVEADTLTDRLGPLEPLELAPGWEPRREAVTGPSLRAQRAGQVERCLDFLTLWAVSSPPGAPVPPRLIGDATIILRAGPGATPLELELGRSV